jgi:hypothetical protein
VASRLAAAASADELASLVSELERLPAEEVADLREESR